MKVAAADRLTSEGLKEPTGAEVTGSPGCFQPEVGGRGGPQQVPLGRGLNKYGRQKEKQRRGRGRPVTGRCVALLRGALLEL